MTFPGRLKKDRRLWLAEVPAFDAITQGRTRREALAMIKDLIETMAGTKEFRATVDSTAAETFELGGNHSRVLVTLLLRRQRQIHGLTLTDAAARLGQRSKNAYARYEQGRAVPTVEKLEQLLRAVAPDQRIVWHIAS